MITIISAVLGFLGSLLPDAMKMFQDHQDKKHELIILEMQMKQQAQGHSERLEEIQANADIAESKALYKTFYTGITWVDALNGTVRPVITYWLFGLYAFVKVAIIWSLISMDIPLVIVVDGINVADALPWQKIPTIAVNPAIWAEPDMALLAGALAYYFGQRGMRKRFQQG